METLRCFPTLHLPVMVTYITPGLPSSSGKSRDSHQPSRPDSITCQWLGHALSVGVLSCLDAGLNSAASLLPSLEHVIVPRSPQLLVLLISNRFTSVSNRQTSVLVPSLKNAKLKQLQNNVKQTLLDFSNCKTLVVMLELQPQLMASLSLSRLTPHQSLTNEGLGQK